MIFVLVPIAHFIFLPFGGLCFLKYLIGRILSSGRFVGHPNSLLF